jgi:sigma-B regulation protein RsbU (phosphoserine phosphatase)
MPETRLHELHIHSPDGKSRKFPLDGETIMLGRASATELSFPEDAGLSRQHLIFEREGGEWNIRDLGSKNGTLLNSVKLTGKSRLRQGDRISAGHLLMVYDEPSATATDPEVRFIPEEENPTSSTVVTDLAGLLSGGSSKAGDMPGALHMGALLRAGNELAMERPLPELFRIILDLSIEAVGAERGVVMTLENDGQLVMRAAKGDAFRISTAVRDRVLNTHVSVLVRDTLLDEALRERVSIVGQRVRTLMAVPLQTKDRIIGLIYVDSPSLTKVFSKEDLNLLTVMANTAAIRIEHTRFVEVEREARAVARDLEQAAVIQQSFLPAAPPQVPGLDLAGHNAPCRTVGGDYYDFFSYPTGRVAMVLGDVSGKGMPASLLMMQLHARVQELLDEPSDLGVFVTRLNRLTAAHCPSNRFITFFACALDSATGELAYCNAGHNPPIILHSDGRVELLDAGGVVLGIVPTFKFEEVRTRLDPGDVLVIYSDGVTEATNPVSEEFEEERLIAVLGGHRMESSAAIVEAINRAITEWGAGSPPADDLTLIVARRVA